MTIILSRTDNIGDLVLTLPMAGKIKECFPQSTVIFITSTYAAPVAQHSKFVDDVILWEELRELTPEQARTVLRVDKQSWCFHVFPRPELARYIKNVGISNRVGTRNRFYHWQTCNYLPAVSRKNSNLHEAQLNLLLLQPLLGSISISLDQISQYYGLEQIPPLPEFLHSVLHPTKKNVVIHPKSSGSAPEWSSEQYTALIRLLPIEEFRFILTGSAREAEKTQLLQALSNTHDIVPVFGQTSLGDLITLIAHADGLLASSTGPLHIAAALGRQTLGLFIPRRPLHAGRWGPIGVFAESLTAVINCTTCGDKVGCSCMASITPAMVTSILKRWKKMP